MKKRSHVIFVAALLAAMSALLWPLSIPVADSPQPGELLIKAPVIRPLPAGRGIASGYLEITNTGEEADRLLAVSSGFAERNEIHTMTIRDDIMRMRPLAEGIVIKAGASAVLKSGGDHLMFMGIKRPLRVGESVKVILLFEKAGAMPVMFEVSER